MSGEPFETPLGPDLRTLVATVPSPLARVAPITGLPAGALARATFRLEFADGCVLKGRRLDDPAQAVRMEAISRGLGLGCLPRVVGRHGTALLEEWVPGVPLPRAGASPKILHRCGAILGTIHGVRVGAGAWGPPALTLTERRAAVMRRLEERAACGLVTVARARRLLAAAERHAPADTAVGFVHRDFCPENTVLTLAGEPCVIDNGTLSLDAYDLDLGRTWYRWPMTGPEREAFEAGYRTRRRLDEYRAAFPFWAVAVLVEAALFRHHARTPGSREPIEHLHVLLRTLDGEPSAPAP